MRVHLDQGRSRLSANDRVEFLLHAGETGVLVADIAEHVRSKLAIGVVAASLAPHRDTFQIELPDTRRLFRRDPSAQPRELQGLAVLVEFGQTADVQLPFLARATLGTPGNAQRSTELINRPRRFMDRTRNGK